MANEESFKLKCFILKTPGNDRYLPLRDSLIRDHRVQVEIIDSLMASDLNSVSALGIKFEQEYFEILHNRFMKPREIACAASHNNARELVAKSNFLGIIFEDDARIENLAELIDQIVIFANSHKEKKAVLSLTKFANMKKSKSSKITRLLGIPNLAVGYALTPEAANSLLNANSPIRYVADWPQSKCQFYVSSNYQVHHGDSETQSVILNGENDYRLRMRKLEKFLQFLFFNYFFKRHNKIQFREYVDIVYWRRIFWHLDKIRLKIHG